MAELKTKPTKTSVVQHIAAVKDPDMRADAKKVLALMKKVTGHKPVIWGSSIIGFGSYHYKSKSGQEGDWPLVSFAVREKQLTLYLTYIVRDFADELNMLGKHKASKGCIHLRRLSDVDMNVLERLVVLAFNKMKETYPSR